MRRILDSLSDRIGALLHRMGEVPYVGVLVRAALKGSKDMSKDMSASIAYFTFLSLFPLILGLFAIGSYFLESEEAQLQINQFLGRVLPRSLDFVTRNIDSLIRMRSVAGITSTLVLMWSASKMVAALSRGVNNALGFEKPFASYISAFRNFGLTLTIALLVFVVLGVMPLIEVVEQFLPDIDNGRWQTSFEVISSHTVSLSLSAFLIGLVYWRVPYHRLAWKYVWPGIAIAAAAIEVGKTLFALYVGNLSRFDAVYGSLSSMMVLMIWLYFSARVVIFGAEVISVNGGARLEPPPEAGTTEHHEQEQQRL